MTIDQLLKMSVGEKVDGGVVFAVKTTKNWTRLPDNNYVFTVVLFDDTGEVLADFKNAAYDPLKKRDNVSIVAAQIQAADPSSKKIALKEGKKLWVDQYVIVTNHASRTEPDYYQGDEELRDWQAVTKGKIRHGLTCAYIRAGKAIDKQEIEKLVEYIFTGE